MRFHGELIRTFLRFENPYLIGFAMRTPVSESQGMKHLLHRKDLP